MQLPSNAQTMIDEYLNELGVHLGKLSGKDSHDILDEIRSHILDAAVTSRGLITESGVQVAIKRLGSASALATTFVNQEMAEPLFATELSSPPAPLLSLVLGFISFNLRQVAALLAALFGYTIAAIAMVCVISKPFNPQRVGLWKIGPNDFSLHLGLLRSAAAPVGHEILGWLIVPTGLILAAALVLITTPSIARTMRKIRNGFAPGASW